MHKLLPLKRESVIVCPKYEDMIEFIKNYVRDISPSDKYFIYLEENHTIYHFLGISIIASSSHIYNDNRIYLQYETVWDKKEYDNIFNKEEIMIGKKIGQFSSLSIEIESDNKINKIEVSKGSIFWEGNPAHPPRKTDIIEVYESEKCKRENNFNNYIESLINKKYDTTLYSELTYKPEETLFD